MNHPEPIQRLIDELCKLPAIGPRSAQRIAYYLIKSDERLSKNLAQAILDLKEKITTCEQCFAISDSKLCQICSDQTRDQSLLCVVEEYRDLLAIEKTHEFKGLYHVLGGYLNPMEAIGPENLKIPQLLNRISRSGITEVILCTSPSVNGEATAIYLANALKDTQIKITRLAYGIPVGAEIDSTDEQTIASALTGRRLFQV
jgi:recombination protein RecR